MSSWGDTFTEQLRGDIFIDQQQTGDGNLTWRARSGRIGGRCRAAQQRRPLPKEPWMTVKSSSPDVSIPDVSITDYVLRHAARLGDKPALIDGPTGRTLTYGQLAESVRRAAAGLSR